MTRLVMRRGGKHQVPQKLRSISYTDEGAESGTLAKEAGTKRETTHAA